MNNSCPSCGAIYNVAQKDIGRRLKCKKCGSSLMVTEAGLEMDGGGAVPAAVGADDDMYEEEAVPRSKKKRSSGGGADPVQLFKDYGGVSLLTTRCKDLRLSISAESNLTLF